MRLYYLPGSCALAPHIALECANAKYDLARLERGQNREPAYLAINPLGTVPALIDDAGSLVTEAHAVLVHIADRHQLAKLAPDQGTPARDQMHRWLSYFTSGMHPSFGMLWRPDRFSMGDPDPVTQMAEVRLVAANKLVDRHLSRSHFMLGDHISIADFYLFVLGRWGLRLQTPTSAYPNLMRLILEMANMPSVMRAMQQEGIALDHPKSGLG